MPAQIGRDEIGERDDPATCFGLRRPEGVAATGQVVDLAGYPDGAGVQVDVFWAKRGEFGPAEASEGGQLDQGAVARPDGVGQGVDLRHGQHRAFGRGLLVRALNPARVTADQPVIDRGVEDRPQQSVRLGRADRADPGIEQSLTPAADPGEGDTGDSDRGEVRRDVGAQQVAVEPDGLRPEARPFLDPCRAEVRDQDRARIRVYQGSGASAAAPGVAADGRAAWGPTRRLRSGQARSVLHPSPCTPVETPRLTGPAPRGSR